MLVKTVLRILNAFYCEWICARWVFRYCKQFIDEPTRAMLVARTITINVNQFDILGIDQLMYWAYSVHWNLRSIFEAIIQDGWHPHLYKSNNFDVDYVPLDWNWFLYPMERIYIRIQYLDAHYIFSEVNFHATKAQFHYRFITFNWLQIYLYLTWSYLIGHWLPLEWMNVIIMKNLKWVTCIS